MPRTKAKRQQAAVECAAHGQRCALFAGRGYRSDRCAPVEPQPRQLSELFALLGIDPAEQQRRDTRSLAEQDADYWHALAAVEAGIAERMAALSDG